MKALIKAEAKTGLWLKSAPMPEISPNDVLIKIHKTAICGTDLHIFAWDEWAQKTIPVPMIIGHEFFGYIEKLGSNVHGFKIGDRVSGESHLTCGHCRHCRAGKRHLCPETIGIGVHRQGAFAEYLSLPQENIYKLPNNISADVAACLDPLGNAAHTALSFNLVGEDVLITGAGPIGMMAVPIARMVGARNIVITDINQHRLDMAEKLGATRAVNIKTENLFDVMKDLDIVNGFDVGLEMSGSPQGFNTMINFMFHGGKIALLGIPPENTTINWHHVIFKELQIKGIYGREIFDTWYKMTALLQSGLDINPIITHRFPADHFQEAFELLQSGKAGKVILDWC